VFPNEKREILAGCAKDKGGPAGCRKGQPSDLPFSAGQLNVQPTGPFCCAARQPVENSCFSFGNIALRLVLSVIETSGNMRCVMILMSQYVFSQLFYNTTIDYADMSSLALSAVFVKLFEVII